MVTETAAALAMLATPARIPLVEEAPSVDCALDDAAWRGARVLDGFHQVHPGDNLPATLTVLYAGYDETGDFTEPVAPVRASRYARRTRTVCCKVSWAFRTRSRG